MNLRGAAQNKQWKSRRRERASVSMSDWVARGVLVSGMELDKKFSFDHNGVHIGSCVADKVYFEGGKRVAELRAEDKTDLNVKLLRAFYSIEART